MEDAYVDLGKFNCEGCATGSAPPIARTSTESVLSDGIAAIVVSGSFLRLLPEVVVHSHLLCVYFDLSTTGCFI
ncbi:hypothetical protein ANCCAN_17332 [Ancylostoma caninum]|uniref:Uncharacterized protein n=1 Tax=Ancylostoma caninum TaxID=29170 RepID=A0A368FX50_ANCCA|nr:hypothetical protein ANCCAN_17332 [Ancylostoma caninum]